MVLKENIIMRMGKVDTLCVQQNFVSVLSVMTWNL